MKQAHPRTLDTRGLRRAMTTLAVAASLAGWAVLARPQAAATTMVAAAPVAQVAAAAPAVARAPAPALRAVTAAPAPVTATRSSR